MRPKALNNVIIKIDPYFNHKGRGLFVSQEGFYTQILPKHGTLVSKLPGLDIPIGATVYFVHYSLSDRFILNGTDTYVPVQPKEILAYENESGELVGAYYLVAKREEEDLESGSLIKDEEKKPDSRFVILSNSTLIDADAGDVVWSIPNREYTLDYKKEVTFLDPNYVGYNETKNKLIGSWALAKKVGSKERDVKVSSLLLPKSIVENPYELEIIKEVEGKFIKGDRVICKYMPESKINYSGGSIMFNVNNVGVCLS